MKTKCEMVVTEYIKRHGLVVKEVKINQQWNKSHDESYIAKTEDGTVVTAFRNYGMNRKWTTTFKVNGKVTKMNS